MFDDYQISAIRQIWIILLVPLIVSVAYWLLSKDENRWRRIFSSLHGCFLLVSFFYAVLVSPITGIENYEFWIWPFYLLLLAFAVTMVFSLIRFQGSRWLHLSVLLLMPSAGMIWFVGTMTITHDWM